VAGASTYLRPRCPGDEDVVGPSPEDDLEPDPWPGPADRGAAPGVPAGATPRWPGTQPDPPHPLTARAFGFPRAIAHGMWTHARVLAALEGRLAARHTVRVQFRKPVLLPSTVELRAGRAENGWDFAVTGRDGAREHLLGTVREPDGTA
jgi:hypothetical protein